MRPFANTILIFLACQFGCLVLFGQVPTLKGRIVDSKSGAPIPFATILLKGKGQEGTFGVVSNTEGDFRIPVSYSERVDTIVVSCIGYVTKKFRISQLSEFRIQIIRLDEATLRLGEVEIKAKSRSRMTALDIVRRAIRISQTIIHFHAKSYVAYYRVIN